MDMHNIDRVKTAIGYSVKHDHTYLTIMLGRGYHLNNNICGIHPIARDHGAQHTIKPFSAAKDRTDYYDLITGECRIVYPEYPDLWFYVESGGHDQILVGKVLNQSDFYFLVGQVEVIYQEFTPSNKKLYNELQPDQYKVLIAKYRELRHLIMEIIATK